MNNEKQRLQKIAGILKENIQEFDQEAGANPHDTYTLMDFATEVSDEINDAYEDQFDSKKADIDPEDYTPEEMYKYISMWAEDHELTPEQAMEEFNWRELTPELGLWMP